jgi:hypothetical protein
MAYTADGGLAILHSFGGEPSRQRSWVDLWGPGATKPVTVADRPREHWQALAVSADGTTLAVAGSAPNGPSNSGVAHVHAVRK